jgi:hypothetical protein
VLDVGRRPTPGRYEALKEREGPAGVLARQLQRDQVAYHPHSLAFARCGVRPALLAFRHSASPLLAPTFSLPKDDGTQRSVSHLLEVYSPECVEGVFCEVRS